MLYEVITLFTTKHKIAGAKSLNRLGECVGGGPGIGTGKGTVGNQNPFVSSTGNGFAKNSFRLGRPHGQDGDDTADLFFDGNRLFKSVPIVGIHDRLDPFTGQGVCFRVQSNVFCIRDLFDTDKSYNFV